MSDQSYNGWTNWETWQVPLWIDNDECTYRARCRVSEWTADSVENFAREMFPDGTPDMDTGADLDSVNWQEIADNWNEE